MESVHKPNILQKPLKWWALLILAAAIYACSFLLGGIIGDFLGVLGLILLILAIVKGVRHYKPTISPYALLSFIFGVMSLVLMNLFVLQGIAIIFGIIALVKFKEARETGKWMAFTGLILGGVLLVSALYFFL